MILRILAIGFILYAVYRLFGGKISLPKMGAGEKSEKNDPEDDDTLIECVKCGTYVTKKEAIEYRGKFYCSKECLPS